MKKLTYTYLIMLICIFVFNYSAVTVTEQEFPNSESERLPELHCPSPPTFGETNSNSGNTVIDKSWFRNAVTNTQKEEYNITYSDVLGKFQSPNRLNNIRFIYHKDGFTAKTRAKKIPLFDMNDKTTEEKDRKYKTFDEWNIHFRIMIEEFEIKNEELMVKGNKAYIENENIRIDYTNNEEGMRQDFIIKQKPVGAGNLRLNLRADTKLKMTVGADALMFKDNNGVEKMKYSSLKCWDANGKELRAYFTQFQITNFKLQTGKKQNSKSKIPDSKSFSIVVNDEDAEYPITIDPLSTSPNWTAESDQANALFGNSSSTAGDVNGDGYSDVIVGSSFYDNGQTDEGRVFVYYGSAAGLSASPNWTAESNQADANFGASVSTAGDVNGDGYSDVIIGAHLFNNGQDKEGRAFVYHGSASGLSASANWTAEGNQIQALFGISVSTAGDVNGDGYSDVIVGASFYDNGHTDEGSVFVYHGSASGLSVSANWTAESNQANSNFGNSVCTAGDVNGDGFSDVIVGATFYDNGQSDEGKVFVYHGSPSGLSVTSNWSAESDQASAQFGTVSSAGDVNGDGYSDVIVGAHRYDNGQTDEGRVFVYHGSASGLSVPVNLTLEINQADAIFAWSIGTAGDVNGDGFGDIIVGARLFDNGQTDEGKVYVYQGSPSGLSPAEIWTFESDQAGAQAGQCASTAGDINGDGFSDILVSASVYDNGQTNEGRAYVFHGSAIGLTGNLNWFDESDQATAHFGYSVSTAGDVNGDGYSDVIVGAPLYDNGETDEGRVFVYHGSSTGLPIASNWVTESNQTGALYGASVATAGDVNGDGYSDVIVGASIYDNEQSDEGRVFVYHGSESGLSLSANWTVECDQTNAHMGHCVSTAGDVNGDGYSDVIIGAPNYNSNKGKAFLYHGSASGLSGFPNWTVEGDEAIFGKYGISVSTAGDVNGDGYSDVIVGSDMSNGGQSIEGTVFIYHGSATGLSFTSNWVKEGNDNGAHFGWSVSTAGDVNGDGYSDVIIGAPGYDDNVQLSEGWAFVYNGSSSGVSNTASWTAQGNQSNIDFGWSVSTAGDVNGDGYSDVIVGALGLDNGQTNEGRALLYQGSSSGLLSLESWIREGDQPEAEFGISVSSAGDVNGDGYSDVIVGAQNFDFGQTDEGLVFVYYGNSETGLRSTVRQYKPGSNNIVCSGGLTGANGQSRINIFGKSTYGRADGKIVYEIRQNGSPFNGNPVTNSVFATGSGINTDLGTTINGVQLNSDLSGYPNNKEFKWRARVQYNPVNNPYQKFGPWRYYTNYIPKPFGGFKAITIDDTPPAISYSGLTDTSNLSGRAFSNVVITDANGVEGTLGKRPRVYYKRQSQPNILDNNSSSTTGWKYIEASGSASPFNFNIDYSLLNGSTVYGDTIQYFVTAQDIRSFGEANVSINSGSFTATPSSVTLTSYSFPVGGMIRSYIVRANATVTGAVTGNGNYSNLSSAFAAINAVNQSGANILITIDANLSEPAGGAVLNSGAWASLTIQPSGGTARTISGATTAGLPLIDLNGADNVTIDGLNTGGNSLTISNTTVSSTAGTSTIRFQTDASNNKIRNCTILGSSTVNPGTAGGNILFGGNSSVTGNDNNLITNCDIGPAGSNLPSMCISSNGTTSSAVFNNSGDTIRNCNIFDYFHASASSSGVYISSGSSNIILKDSKFYQNSSRITTGFQHSAIWISNASGNDFTVSGNTIGFSSSSGAGTYDITGGNSTKFIVMSLSVDTNAATNIQGNTVRNISFSGSASGSTNSSPFRIIYIAAGLVNVGNVSGNIIGSQTEQNSILYSSTSGSGSDVYGVLSIGNSPLNCSNNIIGGMTASNSGTGNSRIYGIRASMGSPSNTFTCGNNIIGGNYSNSIRVTSNNTGNVVIGILDPNPPGIITGNTIRNLSNNGGTGTGNTSSLMGIALNNTRPNQTVSQNSIYNLYNSDPGSAVRVTGLYVSNITGTNLISRNFIHTVSAASPSSIVNGLQTETGTGTYQNNMIRLGLDSSGNSIITGIQMNGISETGGTNNFYFNNVYIGGNPTGGNANTSSFSSTVTGNTRNYRNNIFFNARSNSGSTGKHYAVSVGGTAPNPGGLTASNNIYFANGTGGVLGLFNGGDITSLSSWQSATGQDSNSSFSNPNFIAPDGTVSTVNLHLDTIAPSTAEGNGFDIPSVTDDFDGLLRSTLTPVDIGADAGNFATINVIVSGAITGNGNYFTLSSALAVINSAEQGSANITVTIMANTSEPAGGAVLNEGTWTSLTIQPSGERVITGVITPGFPLIDLNGADNVTIDGINTGGNSLTISNTTAASNSGTSTVRFQSDAVNNTIKNCSILGSAKSPGSGAANIVFGGNALVTGNDNNTIFNCNIGPASANIPAVCITSVGTTTNPALNNSGDTVRNCNIFDYFSNTDPSSGALLSSGTTGFVIKDNKFYQTSSRSQTIGALHTGIQILNTSGNNFTISGNTIGFSSSTGTGTYSLTGVSGTRFIPVYLAVDTTAVTNVQGNIIQNISLTGTPSGFFVNSPFIGIFITAGLTNVGGISGNTIGSQTQQGNITFNTNTPVQCDLVGFYNTGLSPCVFSNNNIGGITSDNSGTGTCRIIAARASMASSSAAFTCRNNIIGGNSNHSIQITSNSNSNLIHGILENGPSFVTTITGNTIRNLANNGGISPNFDASVIGISFNNSSPSQTISQNTIYGLHNDDPSAAVRITGIFFGTGTGTSLISRNFIHTFSAVSPNAIINGIQTSGGAATYQNNMIRLGLDTSGNSVNAGAAIYGISESGGTNSFYFNSVYIGGSPTGGASNSSAFSSSVTINTRKYRNNIFYNARSNNGSTGKHYAINIAGTDPGLFITNNIYFANGSGGVLGLFNGSDVTSLSLWRSAVGQDLNSYSSDPQFVNPEGSLTSVDLHLDTTASTHAEGNGFDIPSVTDDFDGELRNTLSPVDIGADADDFILLVTNKTLNLTMLIQGFYNSGTNTMIRDTVQVYLRNSFSPYLIVDSSLTYVDAAGTGIYTFSYVSDNVPYFIQLKHRNSIGTWSSSAQSFIADSLTYDFSNSGSQAFGNNMVQINASPLKFGIYSGDVNQEGTVDLSDLLLVYNSSSYFETGYITTDVNADSIADLSDLLLTYNNSKNFVSVINP